LLKSYKAFLAVSAGLKVTQIFGEFYRVIDRFFLVLGVVLYLEMVFASVKDMQAGFASE